MRLRRLPLARPTIPDPKPLIPANAGTQILNLRRSLIERFVEIVPSRIGFLNQPQLPTPPPFLHLALAEEGSLARFANLIPDEPVTTVFCGEAAQCLGLVLPHPLGEIVGHADVDRPISLIGDDVDVERHLAEPYDLGPGIRRDERIL